MAFQKKKVFLCYAKEDRERVLDFYNKLKNVGLDPWFDKESLGPGTKWDQAIKKAIRESDYFLVCLTNNTFRQGYFYDVEISRALRISKKKPSNEGYLKPIRFDADCQIPINLKTIQWQDLYTPDGFDRLVKSLGISEKTVKNTNEKSLFTEIEKNNIEEVFLLLETGVNINCIDFSRNTPLMIAASYGYDEIVTNLIKKGAELNKININGHTALMLAAMNGFANTINLLISSGAVYKKCKDGFGHTALMLSAMNGHVEATKILIQSNSPRNIKDNNGRTALWFAEAQNHSKIINLFEDLAWRSINELVF